MSLSCPVPREFMSAFAASAAAGLVSASIAPGQTSEQRDFGESGVQPYVVDLEVVAGVVVACAHIAPFGDECGGAVQFGEITVSCE